MTWTLIDTWMVLTGALIAAACAIPVSLSATMSNSPGFCWIIEIISVVPPADVPSISYSESSAQRSKISI